MRYFSKKRALRLCTRTALTLFFCIFSTASAIGATGDFDVTLHGYVARMVLALLLMGAVGYFAVKYLPGRFRMGAQGKLRLLGALNLGRDMVYLIQTGPDVIAIFVGRTSSTIMGKWSVDEWEDYEAAETIRRDASLHKDGR